MSYQAIKVHGRPLNAYYSVKKSNQKRQHTIDSNYMTSGKGGTMETVNRPVVARSWGRRDGWRSRACRIFKALKLICMMLWWWMCASLHFSKPIMYTSPRLKPKVNYGLRVVMMCCCRFINCNNVIFWYEIYIIGETVHVQGKEYKRKSLYPSLHFL